jgi:hypothetical protein
MKGNLTLSLRRSALRQREVARNWSTESPPMELLLFTHMAMLEFFKPSLKQPRTVSAEELAWMERPQDWKRAGR